MVWFRSLRSLPPAELDRVRTFLDPPLNDQPLNDPPLNDPPLNDLLLADLVFGPRTGFRAVLAEGDDGQLLGYGQASAGNDGYVVDCIVRPSDRGDGIRLQVLQAVLAELPADAGVTWWTHDADGAAAIAAALELEAGRALLQMRRPLPIDVSAHVPANLSLRRFVVGADEAAWLEVNNAAFAWHAEQGGWDLATLQQRECEAWFRPDGFLLHERDGRLAAFCWTKLHPAAPSDQQVGEIYVIAVHPDFHGLGLGRALTVAGLGWLQSAGATEAMLYVDATNTSAVRLYENLSFELSRADQAYVRLPKGRSS